MYITSCLNSSFSYGLLYVDRVVLCCQVYGFPSNYATSKMWLQIVNAEGLCYSAVNLKMILILKAEFCVWTRDIRLVVTDFVHTDLATL